MNISHHLQSPGGSSSRGLLSTLSGFLTGSPHKPRSPSTVPPPPRPEPDSPTKVNEPLPNIEKMPASRNPQRVSNSKSTEPAANDETEGEPEIENQDVEVEEEGDESEGEEYEVDQVIDHRKGPSNGRYSYLVSWKGYGPEHNTWEPQEHLDHATDLVSNYWAKQPKSELGVKKRERASTSANPESAPRPAKAPRVSTIRNGSPAKNGNARQESVEDLPGPDWQGTHVDSFDKYEDVANWEDLVASVDTIEKSSDNGLLVYLTMTGGEQGAVPAEVAYQRAPQKILRFYQAHLKWRVDVP